MRTKQPEIVSAYYKAINTPVPKCCHTCEWYDSAGVCGKFNAVPPESFTQEVNQCDDWMQEIPF